MHSLLSSWSDDVYWRKLCPQLTISSDGGSFTSNTVQKIDEQKERQELLDRLIDDGYALLDVLCNSDLREKVGKSISDLELEHSLPATFALLFDETWQLAAESKHLLLQKQNKGILRSHGKMCFNFDMLAWHIDPRREQVGFSPHRDRQPDTLHALKQSFYSDGQAKYITHWIALAEANPNNSCLYVIPKQFDPGYLEGDDPPESDDSSDATTTDDSGNKNDSSNGSSNFSDPLSRALPTKQSYQNIRALPRRAGESVIFTHRILHWGSAGNPHASKIHPRVAISFVYSDVDYEAPYLTNFSMEGAQLPPFSLRLLLVCSQLLIYYQRFDNLSTQHLRACYEYCKQHADELNETYRKNVFLEFVRAMKERRDGIENDGDDDDTGLVNAKERSRSCTGDGSDDEEAMLEAMLENSDQFDDDYDDAECYDSDDCGEHRSKRTKIR
ncbi:hypothetical protein ACHAWT_010429 [Skeletonema menzelii]